MGIISNLQLEFDTYPPNRIMKLCLLAIALVAGVIAEPESKPYLHGGYYGGLGYGGYGYGLGYYRGKRSADAEPESKAESDPYLVGYYPYGNGYALGHYDLDTMDTTLESDLLMLKLSQKASHGTDMVLDAAMVLVMVLVIVDIMVGENKQSKSYYNNESKFKKNLL